MKAHKTLLDSVWRVSSTSIATASAALPPCILTAAHPQRIPKSYYSRRWQVTQGQQRQQHRFQSNGAALVDDARHECEPTEQFDILELNRVRGRRDVRSEEQRQASVNSSPSKHNKKPPFFNWKVEDTRSGFNERPRGINTASNQSPHISPHNNTRFLNGAKRRRPLLKRDYADLSASELYALAEDYVKSGQYGKLDTIVTSLVVEKHEVPSARLYNLLLLANVHHETGSAARLAMVLDEIKGTNIQLDSLMYHNAIKALAVHPDAVLRNELLQEMRERWFSLTESGWHDLLAGYARDGLFEQALEGLDKMAQENMTIQGWLFDMLVYQLSSIGQLDEALDLLKFRIASGATENMSENAWYFLLDAACEHMHYDCIKYIWKRRVRLFHLNPTSGQCVYMLQTAARAGDVGLATDVLRVLTERKTLLDATHYESLIEACINANDLSTALTVLCIMTSSSLRPTLSSTSSIIRYLSQSPELPHSALAMLETLAQSVRPHPDAASPTPRSLAETEPVVVPATAVNALLEAAVQVSGLASAVEIYKRLHTICVHGPDVHTFNILIRGCVRAQRKDTALFLWAEMKHLGISPDALTYDRLMLVCLLTAGASGSIEDVFKYLDEMKALGFSPRFGTLSHLIRLCSERNDPRAWEVLEEMERDGQRTDTVATRKWLTQIWKGNETAPAGEDSDDTSISAAHISSRA